MQYGLVLKIEMQESMLMFGYFLSHYLILKWLFSNNYIIYFQSKNKSMKHKSNNIKFANIQDNCQFVLHTKDSLIYIEPAYRLIFKHLL